MLYQAVLRSAGVPCDTARSKQSTVLETEQSSEQSLKHTRNTARCRPDDRVLLHLRQTGPIRTFQLLYQARSCNATGRASLAIAIELLGIVR